MTAAKQLPLDTPKAHAAPDICGDAKGFWFGGKDDRDPIKRAHIVIGKYIGRYGRQPGWLTCAPSEAAVIGGDVLGVPVYAVNTSPSLYRLGVQEG